MGTICTLQNLTLTFPHKVIFKNANFNLNSGDKIGVLGLNGHGKTSLFHIMTGHQAPDTTVPPFLYDKSREFSVFLVPQELPVMKIGATDYFYEFFPQLKKLRVELTALEKEMGKSDLSDSKLDELVTKQSVLYEKLEELREPYLHDKYVSYLKYFGLKELDKDIADMSGGEQRKVALSLGLSCPQSVVLWDEPTNHLDLWTIQLFEEELQQCDKTFMLITHDRELLNNIVDRIIHIQHGQIRSYSGTYQQYVLFLQEEELKRLKAVDKLSNHQRRETAWISRGAKARRTKSKKRIEDYDSLNRRLSELKALKHGKVSFELQSTKRQTKELLFAQGLGHKIAGKTLFTDVNVTLMKGDKIALIGDNGTGKSTLLKILMGDLVPDQGLIKRPDHLTAGYFSQKRETLNGEITPWELMGKGIDYVISNTGAKRHVAGYLENFLFSSQEIKRPIKTFSGGEKNRLQLAQFMKDAQDVWIFDEPTNDLDLETIGILEEELKNYSGALIVVGHDRAFLENVTEKCWLIDEQRMQIFEGGINQTLLYIEEKELLKKLKALEKKSTQVSSADASLKTASSSKAPKDQKRIIEIEGLINQLERDAGVLEQFLGAHDYSNTDKAQQDMILKAQEKHGQLKSKIEKLLQEWEQLES